MITTAILNAIAEVESAGGVNNYPRLEISFAPRGRRILVQGRWLTGTGRNFNEIVRERWERFGPASACSYSSWQILYHTAADRGFKGHPAELWNDEVAEFWVRKQLQYIERRGADSVRDIADAWNSGHHADRIVPAAYITKLLAAYERQVSQSGGLRA